MPLMIQCDDVVIEKAPQVWCNLSCNLFVYRFGGKKYVKERCIQDYTTEMMAALKMAAFITLTAVENSTGTSMF